MGKLQLCPAYELKVVLPNPVRITRKCKPLLWPTNEFFFFKWEDILEDKHNEKEDIISPLAWFCICFHAIFPSYFPLPMKFYSYSKAQFHISPQNS